MTQATTAIQQVLERGLDTGPDLNAGAVTGVGYRDVVDVQVLDDVCLAFVLAQRSHANTVQAGIVEVLHNNIGAIGLKRDTVVCIDDNRVLDDDAVRAVRVPAV